MKLTDSLVLGMQKIAEMKQTTDAVVRLCLNNLTSEELDQAIQRHGGAIGLQGRSVPKEEGIYTGWYIDHDHFDHHGERSGGYGIQYAENDEQLLKRQKVSEQLSIPAAHAAKIFEALPGFVVSMMSDFPQLQKRLQPYFDAVGCDLNGFRF